jgi:benzoyl-CoA reductase subunit C
MTDPVGPFRQVLADRHAWIRNYKLESGKRIAGYFCDYVPEEILFAAGMVPVRITAGRGNVVAADRHLQSNVCSFARRCLDQALEGVYDYLDAVVIPHTCDVITKMYDLWAYRVKQTPFVHYVWVPHKVFDRDARAVMEGEIKRLKKCVEEFIGEEITDQAIIEAIQVYDETRSLLRKVYELRESDPPLISGEDAFSIALCSNLSPKDEFNKWVKDFLDERGRQENPPGLETRPRVLIAASALDDLDLVRAVENSGAWVVADDVCTGTRYFWDMVGEAGENPIRALARRYLNKVPCPRSVDSLNPRSEHIFNMARDYQAGGVIFYIMRCCDAHLFQYPILNQRLQEAGYRVLYIQGDQTVGINEGIMNRIKAFTEILSE